MAYEDKYFLTKDQNKRYAKSNFTQLVHTNSRFEGINTTLPQTQTIIDGLGVSGVSIDQINTIVQIKRGWEYILENDDPTSLNTAKKINKIVAKNDALIPGELRTGNVSVNIGENEYIPEKIDPQKEDQFIHDLFKSKASITEKSMRIMYHIMRSQWFWDGNKRTATLIANKVMIDNGAGLINIPLDHWEKWNTLLSNYYKTNNMDKLLNWTYENAIFGITLDK